MTRHSSIFVCAVLVLTCFSSTSAMAEEVYQLRYRLPSALAQADPGTPPDSSTSATLEHENSYNFGSSPLSSPAKSHIVTLQAVGEKGSVKLGSKFTLARGVGASANTFKLGSGTTCVAELEVGATCGIEVLYTSDDDVLQTAVLTFTANNVPVSIQLQGIGYRYLSYSARPDIALKDGVQSEFSALDYVVFHPQAPERDFGKLKFFAQAAPRGFVLDEATGRIVSMHPFYGVGEQRDTVTIFAIYDNRYTVMANFTFVLTN